VLDQCFTIGGTGVQFITNDEAISRAINRWLKPFTFSGTESLIKIYLFSVGESLPLVIPENAQHIHSGYISEHFSYQGLWLIDFQGRARWVADRERKLLLGFVQSRYLQDKEKPWLLEVLVHPMFELLRKRGLYLIHAGGVGLGEKGVLIAGEAGSGKTTLVIELVRQRFRFLSDDRCFFHSAGSGFEILSFPEPVRVYSPNVAELPELQFLRGYEHEEHLKRSFHIEEVYPHCILDRAQLKTVVFPRWGYHGKSRLEAISPSEALREILPLTLEFFFPDTAKAHFQFIGDVVEKIPCFRLYLGRDRGKWHRIVKELIQ